jgi:hypothetical protein
VSSANAETPLFPPLRRPCSISLSCSVRWELIFSKSLPLPGPNNSARQSFPCFLFPICIRQMECCRKSLCTVQQDLSFPCNELSVCIPQTYIQCMMKGPLHLALGSLAAVTQSSPLKNTLSRKCPSLFSRLVPTHRLPLRFEFPPRSCLQHPEYISLRLTVACNFDFHKVFRLQYQNSLSPLLYGPSYSP